jgi:hypothetical protein
MRRKVSTSKFADALAELRKHLGKCPKCKLVSRGIIYDSMCNEGIALTHAMALASVRLITLHRKAYSDPDKYIYACPDRMRHGEDYAKTAEPHLNVAVQEGLF